MLYFSEVLELIQESHHTCTIRQSDIRLGDDLTRDNLLKQATSLKDEEPPLYLDGIKVHNSPTDYRAVHNLQLSRFDGKVWVPIGEMVDLDDIAS